MNHQDRKIVGNEPIIHACGHVGSIHVFADDEYLELRRIQQSGKKCRACRGLMPEEDWRRLIAERTAANLASKAAHREQNRRVEEANRQRRAAREAREAELAGRIASLSKITYERIMLMDRDTLAVAAFMLVLGADPGALGQRKESYVTKIEYFPRVLKWFHDADLVYRMGSDTRGDCFCSVRLGGEWIGMRHGDIRLAAVRCALMVATGAYPATLGHAAREVGPQRIARTETPAADADANDMDALNARAP